MNSQQNISNQRILSSCVKCENPLLSRLISTFKKKTFTQLFLFSSPPPPLIYTVIIISILIVPFFFILKTNKLTALELSRAKESDFRALVFGDSLLVERVKCYLQVRSYCTFGVRRGAVFILSGFKFVTAKFQSGHLFYTYKYTHLFLRTMTKE